MTIPITWTTWLTTAGDIVNTAGSGYWSDEPVGSILSAKKPPARYFIVALPSGTYAIDTKYIAPQKLTRNKKKI